VRPIIGSVSSFGNIYIWTAKHEENWSAFAPDFTELDENLEYEEKEDEFDVVQQDETTQRKLLVQDVELVDVTTNMPIHAYVDSDDEDESEVYYLPTLEIQHQNSDNEKDKVVTKKQKLAPKKKKMLDDQKKPQRKKDRFIEQF
jgi:COMPASS component SWD1